MKIKEAIRRSLRNIISYGDTDIFPFVSPVLHIRGPGPPQCRCCHHARLYVDHRLYLHRQGEMPFDEGPSGWDARRNVKPIRTNQSTSQIATCMVAPSPASRGSGAAHLLPPRHEPPPSLRAGDSAGWFGSRSMISDAFSTIREGIPGSDFPVWAWCWGRWCRALHPRMIGFLD